jgi:iron complex transport system substrate-binding protein
MSQALLPVVSPSPGDSKSSPSESCRRAMRARKPLDRRVVRLTGRCARVMLCLVALPCWASRTVVDELGRKVVLPDHPHRVVCLAPSIVDTMYALGAGGDVAGITEYVKYPAEALTKASVGNPMHPSMEKVVALHPDLVIGFQSGQPLEVNQQVAALGIPVFLVGPHGMAGILRSVRSVGDALNRNQQADALVRQLQARIDAVRARAAGLPRPSVFMPVWYDPIVTVGKGAFITEVIEIAGGRSVTDDLPTEWPSMSLEAVVERAPQALLLVRGGKMTLDLLASRPGWSALPAIKARKVFYLDDRIDLPSPLAIDALEELSKQFHP